VSSRPSSPTGQAPRVEMAGIVKRFGPLEAVSAVDLDLTPGKVHALLGENGAGKTTLMNILGGMLEPDAGEIRIGGTPVKLRSARRAAELGIGMVHQHYMLVKRFTVAENLQVGTRRSRRASAWLQQALETAERLGVDVDAGAVIADLSVDQQQTVEILRALSRGAEIIILDEPTAVLTPQESDRLFETLRKLADDGKSVVFISHKLREVVDHADWITVMRGGSVVANQAAGDVDEAALVRLMIGSDVAPVRSRRVARPVADGSQAVQLSCLGVSAEGITGKSALKEVSLEIRANEIVGLAGIAGNGQRELAEVLTGLRPIAAGSIRTEDRELRSGDPLDFIHAGIGHVPEDRNGTGFSPTRPIWENAVLKSYREAPVGRGWSVSRSAAREFAERLVATANVDVRDVDLPVRVLSGGNAQRLILARELRCSKRALVVAHPTRGLDVRATEGVRELLVEAAGSGVGVLLISADLDEILALSDRVLVLFDGRIVGEFSAEAADRGEIGLCMTGGTAPAGLI
jgi:ABC-type uncharacterized transport system ATPase subunit